MINFLLKFRQSDYIINLLKNRRADGASAIKKDAGNCIHKRGEKRHGNTYTKKICSGF